MSYAMLSTGPQILTPIVKAIGGVNSTANVYNRRPHGFIRNTPMLPMIPMKTNREAEIMAK